MPEKKSSHVFISYSRRDDAVMRRIVKHLREQGIKAWVDNEKLIPGTPVWENEIEKAIKGAFAIVVVLSPDAKNSEWVLREITLADQYQKRAFPVLVTGKNEDSIPFRLITRQFVDIRKDEPVGLKSLSTAISFYSEELTRLEEERLAAERDAAILKHEREIAEQVAREAREEAEQSAKQRLEEERIQKAKFEQERVEKEKADSEKKASVAKKGRANQKSKKEKDQISENPSYKSLNFSFFEGQVKRLTAALSHNFSIGKRKYIGISAVAVIILVGIGFNIFKSQVPFTEEQDTATVTASPTKTSTSTLTRTPTSTLTKTQTAVPTKTITPKPTVNLAATQQAIDSAATEKSAESLFLQSSRWSLKLSDTFKNNNNNWHTATINSEWGTGNIKVTDGKYIWTYTAKKGSIYRAWRYTVSLSDFFLTVDGLETEKSIGGAYGVVFRNSEAGDYYFFGIYPQLRTYFFWLYYNDEWSTITGSTLSSAINSNESNTLTIIAQGSRFSLFINGQFVEQVTDDTLTYGPMGLAIQVNGTNESAIFEFDNLELRTP